MNNKMNQSKTYEVRHLITCDKEDNSELLDSYKFNDYDESVDFYKLKISEKSKINGKQVCVELKDLNGEILMWDHQASDILPQDSIIVTCAHERYIGYAYNITDVRKANAGEQYSYLHPTLDYVTAKFDVIFDNIAELIVAYEGNNYPFNKIASGKALIEDFIYGVKDNNND